MRDTILIVDDEKENRIALQQIFEDKYKILLASDGKDAIAKLSAHLNDIAIILLDILMPVLNGYQVLQVLQAKNILGSIPVILIATKEDEQSEYNCYSLGATAVIQKPFSAQLVQKKVENILELYNTVENMQNQINAQVEILNQQKERLEKFNDNLLEVISNIIESRSTESALHIQRVRGMTTILAKAYQELYPGAGLTDEDVRMIEKASITHDIGKIAIPDSVLLKPGRLTDDEREVMKAHTVNGCDILDLLKDVQDAKVLQYARDICLYHHERYDGKGYPEGLKGDEIPLAAQLVSVIDVYDALVSDRVYKSATDKATAYAMIVGGECGIFEPKLLSCLEYARAELEKFSDECR